MSLRNFRIKQYKVIFHQPHHQNMHGSDIEYICTIECFENEKGHWGEANSNQGFFRVYILTENSEVPDSFYQPQNDVGAFFFRARELGPLMDVLRNEEPVSVYFNSEHPDWNHIFTGLEPVGEEEHRARFFV
jgi:hypothetical protein